MTTDCQRPHPGIGCFVVRNGRFLMGRRHGAHGAGTWSVPGGWIEWGESPEAAAIREVREETGMLVVDARVAAATTTSHPEGMCSVTLWMVARWASGEPVVIEPEKYAEHRWYGLDEALPAPLFEVWEDLLGSPGYGELRAMLSEA